MQARGGAIPHTVKHDRRTGIAELAFHGPITRHDLRASTAECAGLQRKAGVRRFLIDANGWEVTASFFDLVALPEEQYVDEGFDPLSRIAVILPTSPKAVEAAQFYRTACANRGWNVQTFAGREAALEWLMRT